MGEAAQRAYTKKKFSPIPGASATGELPAGPAGKWKRRSQAGCHQDSLKIHSQLREQAGLNKNNIGEGRKGGDPSRHFPADPPASGRAGNNLSTKAYIGNRFGSGEPEISLVSLSLAISYKEDFFSEVFPEVRSIFWIVRRALSAWGPSGLVFQELFQFPAGCLQFGAPQVDSARETCGLEK